MPVRAWLLSRHGPKYPSKKTLNNINKELVKNIQSLLKQLYGVFENGEFRKCDKALKHNQKLIIENLILWKNPMEHGSHKSLNEAGKEFMIGLGTRMKAKLMPLAEKLTANEIEVTALQYIM